MCHECCPACEGECIVGITKAIIGNYSDPIYNVLHQLAGEISEKLLPPSARPNDPITFVEPLFTAFANSSYDSMETAIFPSYFHGKCQRFSKDGQDPPGCPNPDCPVVCGTPGSLVHFYSTLRLIAFNDTRSLLESFVKQGSHPYNQIEQLVKQAQSKHARSVKAKGIERAHGNGDENKLGYAPDFGYTHTHSIYARGLGSMTSRHNHLRIAARAESISGLETILAPVGKLLGAACGPIGDGASDLPNCSWETAMKAYILSFP